MRTLFLFSFGLLCSATNMVVGQIVPHATDADNKVLVAGEAQRYTSLMKAMQQPPTDPNIDVKYYKLNLTITTSPNYLRGIVTMKAMSSVNNLLSVTLDLMNTMTVDSVKMGTSRLSFSQQPTTMALALDRSYGNGELVTVDIFYRGVPGSSIPNSFSFSSHAGTPWAYTFSQPYGARDWWPCKDHPSDKADSVDIWVTANSSYKVGSNGKLIAVINNGNSTTTHRWAERYPICTYLVSLGITNYAEFTNWFKYTQADSMPVLNYVLPEHLPGIRTDLQKTVDMLRIFSDKYSLYPFITEKYGHAEFGLTNSAMEHQTMTSLSRFDEEAVSHELAHQWFGDMITCATWPNLWLNEGFATYSTAVYYEAKYDTSFYWSYMNSCMNSAKNAFGSLYVQDTVNVGRLFGWDLVYCKGATVLHMLRHVLGDSMFFRSLKSYANDPRFRFGTARTENFRQVCETVSGTQLGYFFDEWIYGEKYPHYTYSWEAIPDTDGGYIVPIRIRQTTGTANPEFFIMPVDFRLTGTGLDTTIVLMNTLADQTFSLHVPSLPTAGQLDPNNWILKTASPATTILPATSGVLYGASSNLFTVSRESGIATSIGQIGPHQVQGLAIHPTTRELYGVSSFNFGTYVYRISGATGAGLFERSLAIPNMRAIAFSNGDTLYGATTSGNLYRINLTTGTATAIGPSSGKAYSGLSFRPRTGELWASVREPFDNDSLFIIERNAGTATFTFRGGWASIIPSIAFSLNDSLYGLLGDGGGYLVRLSSSGSQVIGQTWVPLDAIALLPDTTTGVRPIAPRLPSSYKLEQNYPNPFNPTTTIRFQIPHSSFVTLKVFDILGREVATLVNEQKSPCAYTVQWDAKGVASGVYFYRLQSGSYVSTRKLVLMK